MKVGDLVSYEWEMMVDGQWRAMKDIGVIMEIDHHKYYEDCHKYWVIWVSGDNPEWVNSVDLEEVADIYCPG